MTITKFLRDAREAKGIGQSALGRKIGLSNQTISDIERGKRNLPLKYVPALATELGVAEADLTAAVTEFAATKAEA